MELILGNHLKTEHTQKLVRNTEIIPSRNLLQFASNELADYIAEEMTDNPLLDFGEEESSVYQMVDADRIMNPDEEPHIDEYNGYGRESDTGVLRSTGKSAESGGSQRGTLSGQSYSRVYRPDAG